MLRLLSTFPQRSYLYDPFSHAFTAYRWRCGSYTEAPPDAEGQVFSPLTGLYLAVRQGWLRWLTPEGEIVPTPWELAQREPQRAEQAQQRAEQVEQLLEAYRRRFGALE